MRCAVLGSPIAHSLSPVLHRAAYAELGLDWEYDAREVREEELAGFLDGLDAEWRGLSLTMPLKRAVVPLLDEMSERAVQAAAANTVVLDRVGDRLRRVGHNTDIPGAAAALRERLRRGRCAAAIVLGGGATAALGAARAGRPRLRGRDPAGPGRVPGRGDARGGRPAPAAPDGHGPAAGSSAGDPVGPADVLVSTIPVSAQTDDVLRLVDGVAGGLRRGLRPLADAAGRPGPGSPGGSWSAGSTCWSTRPPLQVRADDRPDGSAGGHARRG